MVFTKLVNSILFQKGGEVMKKGGYLFFSALFLAVILLFSCSNPGNTTRPNQPTNLGATALSSTEIKLTWQDKSTNETGFKIERKADASDTWKEIARLGANITTFTNNFLYSNTTYHYRVKAYNAAGDSNYSNEASTTTSKSGFEEKLVMTGGPDGLYIFNVSDPSNPILLSNISIQRLGGSVSGVFVKNNYAYAAIYRKGLAVIDVTNPQEPNQVGFFALNTLNNLYIEGDYAYLATWNGFVLVDVSSPSIPQLVRTFNEFSNCNGIFVKNGYVYLLSSEKRIMIVGARNPSQPKKIIEISVPEVPEEVYVEENYLYVANRSKGLLIYDISDLENPTKVNEFGGSVYFQGVVVENGYAYVANSYNGVMILDVTDPTNPFFLTTVGDGVYGKRIRAERLYLRGRYLYIAGREDGLQIIDVSNPSKPSIVGSYVRCSTPWDVVVKDNFAYTANLDKGVSVIDISIPDNPTIVTNISTGGQAQGITTIGNYLYVSDNMLQIIDVTNPIQPRIVKHLNVDNSTPRKTFIKDNYAYLAGGNGFCILNASNPENPALLSHILKNESFNDVFVNGDYAYLISESKLTLVNIQDPNNPVKVSEWISPEQVRFNGISLKNNYAYLTDDGYGKGLAIVDVNDPRKPELVKYFCNLSWGVNYAAIEINGDVAYISRYGYNLVILDISDPLNPVTIKDYVPEYPKYPSYFSHGIYYKDNYVYLVPIFDGLVIIDVSDLSKPNLIADVDLHCYEVISGN